MPQLLKFYIRRHPFTSGGKCYFYIVCFGSEFRAFSTSTERSKIQSNEKTKRFLRKGQ
jgi:hypothetical protein